MEPHRPARNELQRGIMSAIELSEASLVTLPRNCTAEIRVKTTQVMNAPGAQRAAVQLAAENSIRTVLYRKR